MSEALYAGLDLGSTGLKLLIIDAAGAEVLTEQVPTPWRQSTGGSTEIDAVSLRAAVDALLAAAAAALEALRPGDLVAALAIAGMGETGIIIDEGGRPVSPGYAWFDARGAAEIQGLPPAVRTEFAGRTGLPFGAQVTVAKLAYARAHGTELTGRRWLNLPEFVAMTLGGKALLEYSLTSRTGLLDQDTGEPWPEMLRALGADDSFMPPLRNAGESWGQIDVDVPGVFVGARLTVAGHDHLVAAEANGPLADDHYHVSMGTAEVLLRVIDGPLSFDARARLAAQLINEVRYVVPGKHVLVAGVKTGLVLRRVLQTVGITDRHGRDELDAETMAIPYEGLLAHDSIEVTGARNDDGVYRLLVRADGASPAEIFAAALRHSNEEIQLLIDAMDAELPPARSSLLTGGWAGMRSVQRAREHVLPSPTVSSREQDTAFGAAMAAHRLMDGGAKTLPQRR